MPQSQDKKARVRVKVAELQARDAHITELRRQLQEARIEGAEIHRKTLQWLMLGIWLQGDLVDPEDEDSARELRISKYAFAEELMKLEITRVPIDGDVETAAVFRVRKLTQEQMDASVEEAKAKMAKAKPKPGGKIIIPG